MVRTFYAVDSQEFRTKRPFIWLRTNEGAVFTISIGKSALSDEDSLSGAKVTRMSNPEKPIGSCAGATIEQVNTAAQELITNAILSGNDAASRSAIPKPHVSTEPTVLA